MKKMLKILFNSNYFVLCEKHVNKPNYKQILLKSRYLANFKSARYFSNNQVFIGEDFAYFN